MLLLFWNGSGTASGSVKIIPAKAQVSVGGGAVAIKPVTGKAAL
jgi:hypothetical protein